MRALAASGEEASAVDSLAGALTLAFPQGYVRVFADEGPPMGALLGRLIAAQREEQTAARGVPLGYLARLLRAFDPPMPGPILRPHSRCVMCTDVRDRGGVAGARASSRLAMRRRGRRAPRARTPTRLIARKSRSVIRPSGPRPNGGLCAGTYGRKGQRCSNCRALG
jgi:MalT-like TPR region